MKHERLRLKSLRNKNYLACSAIHVKFQTAHNSNSFTATAYPIIPVYCYFLHINTKKYASPTKSWKVKWPQTIVTQKPEKRDGTKIDIVHCLLLISTSTEFCTGKNVSQCLQFADCADATGSASICILCRCRSYRFHCWQNKHVYTSPSPFFMSAENI